MLLETQLEGYVYYDGVTGTVLASRGLTFQSKPGTGRYRFTFETPVANANKKIRITPTNGALPIEGVASFVSNSSVLFEVVLRNGVTGTAIDGRFWAEVERVFRG